jgi:hypothetical protein
MSAKCPVCYQPLPEAISKRQLELRLQNLASSALAAEKKKL